MTGQRELKYVSLPKIPPCEVCKIELADCFTPFALTHDEKRTDWKFCCGCNHDDYTVFILFDCFFDNPATTVEELAELHKGGNDWENFMAMMVRFQEATQISGA